MMQVVAACIVVVSGVAPLMAQVTATDFQYPLDNYTNRIAQAFGDINTDYDNKRHVADDVGAAAGTTIVAAGAGRIMLSRPWNTCPSWGYILVMEHTLEDGSNITTVYGHLDPSSIKFQEGADDIPRGAVLGEVGHWVKQDGSACWGDHLHFGVRRGAFGAAIGTYPQWLVGYLSEERFPESWVSPTEFLDKSAPPGVCNIGTPLRSVTVSAVERAVSFDGTGFDATRTDSATWVEVAGIEYLYYFYFVRLRRSI